MPYVKDILYIMVDNTCGTLYEYAWNDHETFPYWDKDANNVAPTFAVIKGPQYLPERLIPSACENATGVNTSAIAQELLSNK